MDWQTEVTAWTPGHGCQRKLSSADTECALATTNNSDGCSAAGTWDQCQWVPPPGKHSAIHLFSGATTDVNKHKIPSSINRAGTPVTVLMYFTGVIQLLGEQTKLNC